MAALSLAGCSAVAPAPIRDARPTRLQRGDRMLVEASAPLFTVGAPTTVAFDVLGVTLPARAVAADRVVADLAASTAAHLAAPSTVTVTQTLPGGAVHRWSSDPRTPFAVELFTPGLHRLANGWAARLPGPAWLWWALALVARRRWSPRRCR